MSENYIPFPVDLLPAPIRRFVVEAAAAIHCDPSFVALPLWLCWRRAWAIPGESD